MILERIDKWLQNYSRSEVHHVTRTNEILIVLSRDNWLEYNREIRNLRFRVEIEKSSFNGPRAIGDKFQYAGFTLHVIDGLFNLITPLHKELDYKEVFDPTYLPPKHGR